ncbi:MAG: glycosyltransferase family 2 protein [Candidatus Doudnabacteria bacterium]
MEITGSVILFILAVLIVVNFLLLILHVFLQFFYSLLSPAANLKIKTNQDSSLVSIHIAAYNEPPALLKNSLISLSRLDYPNFEVLLLDNNTKDTDIWVPVKKFCSTLGDKFKFFHIEKLSGFKAGALNYLGTKTDKNSEYTSTIDSDYEIKPDFIKEALAYFSDPSVAFVQFPQAYMNVGAENFGVFLEYKHFFDTYMKAANRFGFVSATGTLTVFKTEILSKVGPYDNSSITEDADVGLKIALSNYKGVFVNKIMGTGLMPYDLESYKKQKSRWADGNITILRKNLRKILLSKLKIKQKIGIIGSFLAWVNFTLLPIAALIILSLLVYANVISRNPTVDFIVLLSAFSLVLFHFIKLMSFIVLYAKKYPFKNIVRAFLVHTGMSWTYAIMLFKPFFDRVAYFERTNKFILPKMPSVIKNTLWEICVGTLALVLGIAFALRGEYYSFPLFLIAILCFSVFYVYYETTTTKLKSALLLSEIEQKLKKYENSSASSVVENSSA